MTESSGVIFAVGARLNLLASHDWGARYAQAVLRALPQNAVVITQGDPDLAPIGYFIRCALMPARSSACSTR